MDVSRTVSHSTSDNLVLQLQRTTARNPTTWDPTDTLRLLDNEKKSPPLHLTSILAEASPTLHNDSRSSSSTRSFGIAPASTITTLSGSDASICVRCGWSASGSSDLERQVDFLVFYADYKSNENDLNLVSRYVVPEWMGENYADPDYILIEKEY